MTMLSEVCLPEGFVITGRWNGHVYRVLGLLGEGANGKVYLVRQGRDLFALKMGFDLPDLQSEINILKSLMQGSAEYRGFMTDVDDIRLGARCLPFYVMRYVKGLPPLTFIRKYGPEWFHVIGGGLLRKLANLHRSGWAFCDLKQENVLVTGNGKVELIDFGGLTPIGKPVRQFTEFSDRGYWNAGSRTADEGYDLFAFAILCLQLAAKKPDFAQFAGWLPQNRHTGELVATIRACPLLQPYAPVLVRAVQGAYRSSPDALTDWNRSFSGHARPMPVRAARPWLGLSFAASLVFFASAAYYCWH